MSLTLMIMSSEMKARGGLLEGSKWDLFLPRVVPADENQPHLYIPCKQGMFLFGLKECQKRAFTPSIRYWKKYFQCNFILIVSLQGRSSICGSKSCWSVTHHQPRDAVERRSSAPPPLNANVLRVRKFSLAFEFENTINPPCACHNYARACFGFCKRRRRLSAQVNRVCNI